MTDTTTTTTTPLTVTARPIARLSGKGWPPATDETGHNRSKRP